MDRLILSNVLCGVLRQRERWRKSKDPWPSIYAMGRALRSYRRAQRAYRRHSKTETMEPRGSDRPPALSQREGKPDTRVNKLRHSLYARSCASGPTLGRQSQPSSLACVYLSQVTSQSRTFLQPPPPLPAVSNERRPRKKRCITLILY